MKVVSQCRIRQGEHASSTDILTIGLSFQGVFTDESIHDPGGHLEAVKGHGHGQGDQVDVVHVVGVSVIQIRIAFVVVVEGTAPHKGGSHILVEFVAGHDGSHIVIQHSGAAGSVGQEDGLDAHADLEGSIRQGPVKVGVLHFDAGIVSTEGAAVTSLAPGGVADFKLHGTGQVFTGNGFQLQAEALGSGELVVAVELLLVAGNMVLFNQVAVTGGEAHQPLAGSLEINSLSCGGSGENETGSQEKSN